MSLVPDHLDPATQAKYESICRKYSVTSDTTWADIKSMVEATKNQNTRRSEIIALRTILGTQGAPSIPTATRKVYSLPTAEEIVRRAQGPYEGFILSMAFAGLRIGEAVALSKTDLKRNGDLCWIDVSLSRQNLKGRYKKPKSGQGRVVIPAWLYEKLQEFDYPEILPNSLYKWMKRRGLQPHGLRHFYATYLVRNVSNPELARRQLRHANLETTLGTYVEITSMDEMAAVSGLENLFEAA